MMKTVCDGVIDMDLENSNPEASSLTGQICGNGTAETNIPSIIKRYLAYGHAVNSIRQA